MSLQLVYTWSKKIHRLAMWFAILLGVPLATSGLLLHKIVEGESLPFPIDPLQIRWLHGKVSTPFALILALMMVTGFLMWVIPKILSRRAQSNIS